MCLRTLCRPVAGRTPPPDGSSITPQQDRGTRGRNGPNEVTSRRPNPTKCAIGWLCKTGVVGMV